jgi:methionyl-tRNA synthetase
LFTKIPDEKEAEWRSAYGGTQASRLAEEEAKAKKAADKARDKERKKAKVRKPPQKFPLSPGCGSGFCFQSEECFNYSSHLLVISAC